MIIRLKIDRQIVWPLVALYMLQFFFGAHKVVLTAKREADKKNIMVIRNHKSTINAVESLIKQIVLN